MKYGLESYLPIKAFSPRARGPFSRGMTLEGGGGGGGGPASWVGDAVSSIGDALASIDPGPAIGNAGAQLDKAVGQAVPGGWATLGVAALAIAAPYLAPYLAEAAPALTVGEGSALAGTGAGTLATAEGGTAALGTLAPSVAAPIGSGLSASGGIGLSAGSGGVLGSGVAGMGGAMGTGLTLGGIGAGPASILSGIAAGAGTGSLYGGGMGTVNSLIRGTDPLKGALTGALMGGLTGASLSGIGQTLAQYGINSPALSSAILSASKGLASGANPSTILANTALYTGLSYLGNQASTGLTQAGVDPNVSKILASTGLGAANAGATGGDPITGAENAAVGSTLGLGLGAGIDAGKGLLTAPSASAEPATIHDYSTPIPNGTVSLAGIEGPLTTDIASQYLKNQADQISGDLAKYYPTLSEQQASLADAANKSNDIYSQNQTDKMALSDAITKTGYNDLRDNTTQLATTAKTLYDQVAPIQAQYDAAVAKYDASGRTDRASYDLANSLAPQLNSLIPQFNTAYTAYDTANQNLANVYKTSIEPLYTAFTTSSDNLKTALTDYSNYDANLAKTSNIIANDLQGLDKISQGQLASGWSPGEATMQAPTNSATADSYYNQLVNAIANPDQPSTTGSQTAANVTVEGAPATMTDVGGGATTPYVPTQNPETPNYPAGTTVKDDGSATVKNADGSTDNYDANGNLVSTTPAPSDNQPIDTGVSPTDIIANLPTDNTPAPVDTGALPVTPTPVDTGALPVTPAPVDTGALPVTPAPVDTGVLPTDIIANLPTDLSNLPVAPPATGGGTAPQGGGLPTTTDGSGTVAGGTTDSGGTVAGGTTPTTTTGGGTTPTTTTTGGGTTPTTTATGGGGGGTTSGTTAGLTAAGLAALLAGLNLKSGTSTTPSSTTTTPTAPKGTFVHGKQITSPLGSFNVPTINYATPATNPNSLEEIQNAATGGIMHLATGGSSEDDLSLKPVLMRGKQAQHANLFGLGGIPLYPIPGKAEGGSIPQGFNPQFYSEGGLGTMQNKYVQGPGTGTSDSIPAMLSNGEFVIPANVVSALGNGSNDNGAKVLDSFLKAIKSQKQKHDSKHQPLDSKGALGYLLEAKRKVKK